MSLVWDLHLPPGEKLVLLALADQANDEGVQCWPSLARIAHRSGQGERTVRRALRSLENKGHLTSQPRHGTSSQYHIHPGQNGPPAKMAPRPNKTITPAKMAPHPGHGGPLSINESSEPSSDRDFLIGGDKIGELVRKSASRLSAERGHMSDSTVALLRRDCPGWDLNVLHDTFSTWVNGDPSRHPDNWQKAFIGWVRRHHKKNRHMLPA